MSIVKNEIPILEFDTNKNAVIMPNHANLDLLLPEKCVYVFLGDYVDVYAKENNAAQVALFESETRNYPIYIVEYRNQKICLVQAPVGAAAATQIMDWLIGYGVRKIISAGCCGVLDDFDENVFLVPSKALRDEGTSYHYMSPSRFIEIDQTVLNVIKKAMIAENIKYREVITWSTDGFYRETKEIVEYRRSEGCSVVEMECSALAACASFRNALFGQILYTADTLANVEKYDARDWGSASVNCAMRLCFEIVSKL